MPRIGRGKMADNVHSVCSALGVVEWTGCYVLKSEPGSSSDRYRGVGLAEWVALACKIGVGPNPSRQTWNLLKVQYCT